MDNITACAIAARRAGMTYGQYMATRPRTARVVLPEPKPATFRACKHCGKEFDLEDRGRSALYCTTECYHEALKKRAKEKAREKNKISDDDVLICPQCGKSFVRGNRHASIKYCSEECTVARRLARQRERNGTGG